MHWILTSLYISQPPTFCYHSSKHLLRTKWPFEHHNHVSRAQSVRLITDCWPWWVSNNSLAEHSVARAAGGVKVRGWGCGGQVGGTADWIKIRGHPQNVRYQDVWHLVEFSGGDLKMPNVKETTFTNSKSSCSSCYCVIFVFLTLNNNCRLLFLLNLRRLMKNVIRIITNLIKNPVQGQKIEIKKIKYQIKIEL